MKLARDDALARLVAADHAILCTVHPERGVDAVPCAFAIDGDGFVGIPVDRVKPKSSNRLQRERNLESDSRATLLVEQWDKDDWSRLWWVRARLVSVREATAEREEGLAALLAARYEQYRDRPFDRIRVLRVIEVTGWAASLNAPDQPDPQGA
jgi:PPOX class probable F420-dependent enzyme